MKYSEVNPYSIFFIYKLYKKYIESKINYSELGSFIWIPSSTIRRLTRVAVFAQNTRSTVRSESIVFPDLPMMIPISSGATFKDRRVPSSSCFSVISIASTRSTSVSISIRRNACASIVRRVK